MDHRVDLHDHDYCEICLVLKGSGIHRTKDYCRPLGRGDIIISSPGEIHGFEPGPNLEVLNVYYLPEWMEREGVDFESHAIVFNLFFARARFLRSFGWPIPHFRGDNLATEKMERELQDILAENLLEKPSAAYIRAAFSKFILMVGKVYPGDERSLKSVFREEVWSLVLEIENMIREGRPFEVSKFNLCPKVGRAHLARIFKQQTGRTPSEYYQYRRIQQSCSLLLNRRLSITEIALDLGYSDASHFGRQFQRFMRTTPKNYRLFYRA